MDTFIWIALMVVFLVVEAACPIHLVSIWFAAGSLVAAVVSMLHGQLWLQILLFAVVSGGLLCAGAPVVWAGSSPVGLSSRSRKNSTPPASSANAAATAMMIFSFRCRASRSCRSR